MNDSGEGVKLLIGGGAVGSIVGAIAMYVNARRQRTEITPQPLDVRQADGTTPRFQCNERHASIDRQMENLFARMAIAETGLVAQRVTQETMKESLHSMDNKLDILLRRK